MSIWQPVDEILLWYHKTHDLKLVPISVSKLREKMEPMASVDKIYWEEVDCETENVIAQVSFYEASTGVYAGNGEYARIQYVRSNNDCWSRFVICKEMYQCILDDTKEKRTGDRNKVLALIDNLSSDFIDVLAGEVDVREAYNTEIIAEVFAIETLFPYELRRKYFNDYDVGRISDYQIAVRYKLPEEVVREVMTNATYSSAIHRGRELVDIS